MAFFCRCNTQTCWFLRDDILQQLLDLSSLSALGHYYDKTFRMSKKVAVAEGVQTLRGKIIYIQQVYFYEDKSLVSPYWKGSPIIILLPGDLLVPLGHKALLVSQC